MKAKSELDDDFRQALVATNGIRIGTCGLRIRLRRWVHMLVTPIRFPDQGGISWRIFFFAACLMGGYGALLWEGRSPKVTTVLHAGGHAGLDLRTVADNDCPAWKITNFWAWPSGHGRGKDVLTAVLTAADA